jgi:hypothetical protein
MMLRPACCLLLWVSLGIAAPVASLAKATSEDLTIEARWRVFAESGEQRTPALVFPFAHCFRRAAATHDLPETLLLAVARGESDFDPQARSHANAYGLMQILWPQTARHLGMTRLSQLLDPCTNVEAGARYLKELLQKYQGNLHRALAAYNYGPSRIPVSGGVVPAGATWYSGYILRHLDYVLSRNGKGRSDLGPRPYAADDKWFIIRFERPYRAASFVESLQPKFGDIRLDWFQRPDTGFDVVMSYQNEKNLRRGKRLLSELGF